MKQTEIGMIPDDWEVTTIGQQTEIFGRIGFRGYTINDIVDEGFGAITLSPSNIQNNKMDYSKCTYLSWAKYEESPEIKIYDGDILIVKTGSTYGKSAIVKNLRKKATINPQFVVLKKIKCSNELLSYLIQNPIIQSQIEETIVGGAIPTLSQKQIASFKLPLPPTLAEQQKIAKALSDVDNVITTLEKLITKKKNLKQGTMQQLLTGKKRLPGFAKSNKFKQTEIGEIPEDWEVKELGEVAKNFTGLTFSPDDVCDYGTLVLRSSNIQNDMLSFNDNVYVNMNIPERAIAHKGDILICVRNGSKRLIGKSALITDSADKCAFGAFMTVLRTELLNQQFLFYVWQSDLIQKQIEESMGATINQITNKDIKHFLITYPKLAAEQTAIANVLSSMDKEIEALNTKLEKYRNLKTGMMQQLLTGKIRLV